MRSAPWKGPHVMTVADRTEGQQARCLPHLVTLRMLARDEAEAPSP
jgi:hypothetical protein